MRGESPAPGPLGEPLVIEHTDGYEFHWAAGTIRVSVSKLREHREEVTAEVRIDTDLPPNPGALEWGRLNLTAIETRNRLAKTLWDRCPGVDWAGALLQAFHGTLKGLREGSPTLELPILERPASRWLLWPYVEYGGPSILFGDGGSGKSLLAMAMALSVATGSNIMGQPKTVPQKVLYLDWEGDEFTHSERLEAIWNTNQFGKPMPHIHYRHMVSSLADSAAFAKREIERLQVGFAIVDSVSWAGGADLNEQSTAQAFFAAVRYLGVPTVGIGHVIKNREDSYKPSPFGSVFWRNGARLLWQVEYDRQDGTTDMTIKLEQVKENDVVRAAMHGVRLAFKNIGEQGEERLVGLKISRTDLTQSKWAHKLPLRSRILAALTGGSQTYQEIADELDANPKTVQKTLSMMKRDGRVIQLPQDRWGRALNG